MTDNSRKGKYDEDTAHTSGDTGYAMLAVRKDTAVALAGSDGDYALLEVDASGRLHVAPLPAGTALMGKVGIDQVTANANEVVVKSRSYTGQDRTTTSGAAEELTIPSNSKQVILSCGPSTQCYINLNADATTSSPLYFEDPFGPIVLDLGSVTKLSAYVVAGNVGAVFFG
jgi:hypothetical protein